VVAGTFPKDEFIETLTGNRVNKKSVLCGSQNIRLAGKVIIQAGAIIRGDLANVAMGRFGAIGENSVIRPGYKRFKGGIAFIPLTLGDYIIVESECVVSGASVGSYVHIGKGSVIGRRCVIRDCVVIKPGSVVPADTVVPPFSVVEGVPALVTGELPESFQEYQTQLCHSYYDSWQFGSKT